MKYCYKAEHCGGCPFGTADRGCPIANSPSCECPIEERKRKELESAAAISARTTQGKSIYHQRTYTVTEFCPHCETEIEMRWNTDKMGFYAFCPVCGGRLMLCDECRHAGCGPCDYDSKTDSCRHNPATPAIKVVHPEKA